MLLVSQVFAQDSIRIEISGVGARQIPVVIAGFAGEASAKQKLSAIIKADLGRSGMFRIIDTTDILAEDASINHNDWRAKGAEALAAGSVKRTADGRYEVRYSLHDTIKAQPVSSLSLGSSEKALRLSAHKIADDIYEKLTGIKGIFATRIAYITKA
ncbi:Tol-Pal system protein TolB, partial [Oxalobacter sp. OttesenSCG-928-P03]|nr:Tol-Pal system protein TolB [Oxalobacter sp. OttesenSCG-928-P03]